MPPIAFVDAHNHFQDLERRPLVGYNVQAAVDIKHHLILTHDVTNVGNDRSQLARIAQEAKATLGDAEPRCRGRSGLLRQ